MRPISRRAARAAGAVALSFTGVVAIGTGATATAAGSPETPALAGTFATVDDLFASVTAQRVPEFGGLYVDEAAGAVVVYTTNASPSAARAARDAVASALPDLQGLTVRTVKGRYDFASLKGWHDELSPRVLALQGAVSTDVDDARNRIVVGVEDVGRDGTAVEREIVRLGVPRDAVLVENVAPVQLDQTVPVPGTVQDTPYRPIIGGIQMSFLRSGSEFVCTIGFPAVRGGVTGIVSNSHCTEIQGGVHGTSVYQPFEFGAGTQIAIETVDPVYGTAGGACPVGRVCRYSDSAFFASIGYVPAPVEQGSIARTGVGMGVGWNMQDKWRIVGEGDAVVGQTITKQGRTTGRTSGSMSAVCVNTNLAGSTITQLCQSQVGTDISDSGDSGSPFFSISGTDVTLRGLNWGSNGTTTTFSPISAVQRSDEMGALSNCASGFSC